MRVCPILAVLVGIGAAAGADGVPSAAADPPRTVGQPVPNAVEPLPEPPTAVAAPMPTRPGKRPLVVLDPGHGGSNLGAQGSMPDLREKQLTLILANLVAVHLRDHGLEVQLTRTSDRTLTLRQRVDTANKLAADAFVSIHANASATRSMRGFETFVLTARGVDVDGRFVLVQPLATWLSLVTGAPLVAVKPHGASIPMACASSWPGTSAEQARLKRGSS